MRTRRGNEISLCGSGKVHRSSLVKKEGKSNLIFLRKLNDPIEIIIDVVEFQTQDVLHIFS